MSLTEYQHCVELAIWLDRNKILYTHIPNGGKRNAREAASFKRMGVKAGVPDYLIFDHPTNSIGFYEQWRGVALEMKRDTNGATSAKQKRWLRELEERGWIALVCHGYEDAINKLKELGYGD